MAVTLEMCDIAVERITAASNANLDGPPAGFFTNHPLAVLVGANCPFLQQLDALAPLDMAINGGIGNIIGLAVAFGYECARVEREAVEFDRLVNA